MTICFFKTNRTTDPGFELTAGEVARQFWASDEAREWLTKPSGRLERLALSWVPDNLGSWEHHEDWNKIYDAIHAAMPREQDNEALEDTLDLLADSEAMDQLAEAEADVAAGRTLSADELRASFGLNE